MSRREVNVVSLVEDAIRVTKTRAQQQDVILTTELPPQPVMLNVDPDQLRQVLLNLILNALDVLPQGGAISTELAQQESDGRLNLRVRDNGPGIESKEMDRIFGPFFSTHESGTGIGLPICRQIIEQHSGQITVENNAAGGALFTVSLPHIADEQETPDIS